MDHSQPASMQDVAKAASVSPQTVSRVANGSNAVRPETRQRVEAAMAKLGYRPNYAARALKHGKFKDVGVVLFNMLTYGNARILGGIADAANSNGYAITMQSFGRNRERTLHAAIERMKQLPVDGVIAVMEEHVTDFSEFRPPKELPVVIISEDPANYCPTIDADQYGCSAAVVDYLLSKGHKTVYHIAGPSSSRAAESRAQGLARHARPTGAAHPSDLYGRLGGGQRISGRTRAGLTTPIAPRSMRPTTRWRMARCSDCRPPANACRKTSASSEWTIR